MDQTIQKNNQIVNKQLSECKISYDEFCFYMNEVVKQYNTLLVLYTSDITGDIIVNLSSMVGIVKELLEKLCDDNNGWIDYYIYELRCGEKYKDNYVIDDSGNNVPLRTITDLWNLLNDERLKNGNCNNIKGDY